MLAACIEYTRACLRTYGLSEMCKNSPTLSCVAHAGAVPQSRRVQGEQRALHCMLCS